MIQLNGSYGEGGGALVRTALALSTLTGQSFEVKNIRSGRPEPGLKPQHLTAINALKLISSAQTNKIQIGSTELRFIPGKIKKGIYEIDIGTAGSISLLLQALILPCLFASGKITLKIKGGTCGKWQASVYYIQNVLLPQLQRFVDKIELKVLKPGYYPRGGGEVHLCVSPRLNFNNLENISVRAAKFNLLKQGHLEQIKGVINLSSELQEKNVGERIKLSAESILKKYSVPINIRIEYANALSIGGEVVLWAVFGHKDPVDYDNPVILGGDALVEKRSEDIGKEAAEKLIGEISSVATVDHYLTDQLIHFMGLLPGSEIKCSKISDHVKTNIYVAEKFLKVKFTISENNIKVETI